MARVFFTLVLRDLSLAVRRGSSVGLMLGFFVLTATLFPFALGSDAALLAPLAGGIVWVAALLATLLAVPQLYADDEADGTLDQYRLLPIALEWLVAAKWLAHWLATTLPLMLCAPLVALALRMQLEQVPVLLCSLALGMPTVTALTAMMAALTLGSQMRGAALLLLLFPLLVPVVIFAASAAGAPNIAAAWFSLQALVIALCVALPMSIFVGAWGIRKE